MGDYTGERLIGLNYDAMVPTQERSVSLVGGTCFCPVPSWASLYSFPLVFPPTSCLCRATLLFSKTFLVRSLRDWEGQAESHSLVPLAPPRPENQSCEEPQWATRAAQVWGWDLEIA